MKKRPPKRLETIDNLLEQAEHYAEWMMRGSAGSVPPALMALTPEGFLIHIPTRMGTQEDKDRFAKVIRLIAVAYRATAVATIMESWIVLPKRRGQEVDLSVPPSESPDREEVVSVIAEASQGYATRFLFIQRDSLGKFTGFGTSLLPSYTDQLERRFTGLMPPKEPTDEMVMSARNLLQMMGISVEQAGFNPKWN